MEEEIIKKTKQMVTGATLSGKMTALLNIAERIESKGLLTQPLLDTLNEIKEEYRVEMQANDQN